LPAREIAATFGANDSILSISARNPPGVRCEIFTTIQKYVWVQVWPVEQHEYLDGPENVDPVIRPKSLRNGRKLYQHLGRAQIRADGLLNLDNVAIVRLAPHDALGDVVPKTRRLRLRAE
jgi:hypothetical protein